MRKHLLLNLLLVILFGTAYGQGPNITGLSPIDNATSIPIQSQFRIFFDANIQKGLGAIEIRQWENDAVVETIDVNSVRVTILNAVATISPTVALSTASAYYITVEPGAIENLAGEPFVGFTDNATWNFTTVCGPGPVNLGGATTNYTAVLNWDEVSGAEDYQLWVSHIGVIPSTDGDNFYVLNDLAPGYTYDWTVKYRCASLDNMVYSDSSFSQFRTRGTNLCANAPTGLNAAVTKESATLTWNAVAGVAYEISVGDSGIVADNIIGNTYELLGLSSSTTYNFTVRASCAEYLKSEWAEEVYFTTESCATVPTGLSVSDITDNSVMLNWDDMDAEDYQLWISGIGTIKSTNGMNTYSITNLVAGSVYSWSVRSACVEKGKYIVSSSAQGSFTTSGENPCASAPTGLYTDVVSENEVTLSWDVKEGVSDYRVWISGRGTVQSTNGLNSLTINDLTSGSTYSWSVKSVCAKTGRYFFSSSTLGEDFTTSGENPCSTAPTGLYADVVSENEVTLNWDIKEGASDYQVWISGRGTVQSTNGVNSLTINDLVSGSTYSWSVRSVCAKTGSYFFSSSALGEDFTTLGESPCSSAPTGLYANIVSEREVTLNWDVKEGVSDYQVWISGKGVIRSTNGLNSYTVTDLIAGNSYSWSVKSVCAKTGSYYLSNSSMGEFTTPVVIEENMFVIEPDVQLPETLTNKNDQELVISIYPNPVIDELNITVTGDDVITSWFIISNSLGNVLKQNDKLNSTFETIHLREFGAGIYIVKVIINGNKEVIKRIIIQ